MDKDRADIKENAIYRLDSQLLAILLKDRSSGGNILWATDHYAARGYGYQRGDPITEAAITGYNGNVVRPRTEKSRREQTIRIREKAEVFTPAWICNRQNNLADSAWFGAEDIFNTETGRTWKAAERPIPFPTPDGKTWQDYVTDLRLELACGEAPYLASRYDAVTGEVLPLPQRIGLLDRKLRVVSENTDTEDAWLRWAEAACKSVYGYDWQGDNVLLARENLLFTYLDYYRARFEGMPAPAAVRKIAHILSWNIWQMDGLKYVIPGSCRGAPADPQYGIFDGETQTPPCPGCAKNDPFRHTGTYCRIKNWQTGRAVRFVSLLKERKGDRR